MSTRIILVDNHKIMRDGLRFMLDKFPDLSVVGEADNGRDGVALAEELSPDVVIMDITMPDLNGIDATRRIKKLFPQIKVIALSMHSDRRYVIRMLQAGASGYVIKDSAFEELSRAISTTINGQTYLSPEITGEVIRDLMAAPSMNEDLISSPLTPKEREVLQLIAEGWTTKEIAIRQQVSVKTIETHRRQLMTKLNAKSVADLTKFAIQEGLTSLDL
jgi:DNA-binding NarL/FixJ family response regulator